MLTPHGPCRVPDGRHRSLSGRKGSGSSGLPSGVGPPRHMRCRPRCTWISTHLNRGLKDNNNHITPSQVYAYALLKMGVPFANGAPNLTVDIPAMGRPGFPRRPAHRWQRLQNWSDPDENNDRSGAKSSDVGNRRLVLDQHSRQQGWRGSRRPRQLQIQEVSKLGVLEHILQPVSTRSSTGHLSTRFESTTTHLKAMTKRAGTTSTSRDGSDIRCRSRSTSYVRTQYSQHQSCSTLPIHGPRPPRWSEWGSRVAFLLLQESPARRRSVSGE